MIVVLEREYDFTDVPEFYHEEDKKWYKAEMPTSSRKLSPLLRSFNTVWLKWNLTGERECCLLVLNLVSSTLPCIRQPRPRLRVVDVCGFV